ncbi:MAG: diguanylate cyclase [Gallionella sp.]|nr:diguanylate cyclase [Gallionella sp.]MDP1939380.1 diguanylate cyclase [Gallionella sp.]
MPTSSASNEELLHELQVHQIELQMQNENLRQIQLDLEVTRDRYLDLYDFSPIAYLTLNEHGLITAINLTGADLLGAERNTLLNYPFSRFFAAEAGDQWRHCLIDAFKCKQRHHCELPIQRRDHSTFIAHLDCLYMPSGEDGPSIRIAISDISERKQVEALQRVSALKYRMLYESSRDALMTLAPPSWKFTDANEATLKLFGAASVAEFTALGPWDISPEFQPDGRPSSEKAPEMIGIALEQGSNFFEWRHQKLSGQLFDADVLLTRMQLGEEVFVQATVRDITVSKQSARRLAEAQVVAESEEKFRKISESAYDAIIMMGPDKCISFWNPAAERMFGYSVQEALGQEMHPLLAPAEVAAQFEHGFRSFQKTGNGHVIGKTLELSALRKGGVVFPVEVTISALQINGKWNAIGIFRDITEHKLAEEKIRQLAFYDPLTHLPNRRLLNERLDQAMAVSKRSGRYGALMFLDLDNFKPLNDQHGHSMGDVLLVEVGNRITRCLRETDTVARFGGDEFVVLLSELDSNKAESIAQANTVAEKIRVSLAQTYCMKGQPSGDVEISVEHRCTSSIGVVVFINHEISVEDVLKWADMAMYQAKDGGRNRVCFLEPDDRLV